MVLTFLIQRHKSSVFGLSLWKTKRSFSPRPGSRTHQVPTSPSSESHMHVFPNQNPTCSFRNSRRPVRHSPVNVSRQTSYPTTVSSCSPRNGNSPTVYTLCPPLERTYRERCRPLVSSTVRRLTRISSISTDVSPYYGHMNHSSLVPLRKTSGTPMEENLYLCPSRTGSSRLYWFQTRR